jgi:hypothetical protein
VELDWIFAAEHEFNATIFGEFVTCIPANVSDSELSGNGPVVSKPMTERTVNRTVQEETELTFDVAHLLLSQPPATVSPSQRLARGFVPSRKIRLRSCDEGSRRHRAECVRIIAFLSRGSGPLGICLRCQRLEEVLYREE